VTERLPGPGRRGLDEQGQAKSGLDEPGPHEPGPHEQSEVKRSMGERTWTGAIGEVWRSALRHKIVSAVVALCVVGSLTGIALASSASGQAAKPADPAASVFSLPALDQSGPQVSLRSYQGKPLIVNFFASWCDPCQKETPLLATFYRTEHGKVAIVGLDENDVRTNAMSFTQRYGVGYPVGFDPTAVAATAYGVIALPQTFFLNARHHIVDRIFGAVTLSELNQGIALATSK
jgi:cytochrome c biogenesis protein CcmG/thiol:disulfide interchange protein DsbE